MKKTLKFHSHHSPAGDQPQAIASITKAFKQGESDHILLGVTGSGKTFTMAKVIAELNRSALVIAPNKTLAGQLYLEFKSLFPENAVGYFISYYDYFQPEAYVPTTDTYIAKDSSVNEDIDKMRHDSTRILFEENPCIIVSSVSCIYGLGSPDSYANSSVTIEVGQEISRDQLLRSLVDIQFSRNDMQLSRGHFRVRGDNVDILPPHQKDEGVRISFFGDEVDEILIIDALSGKAKESVPQVSLYPNSHYITPKKELHSIIEEIQTDLGHRLRQLKQENKLVEFQRLEQRTMQDIETLEQLGFCPGIENYSRYLSGKAEGEPPPCLLDYFPNDFITIIDESHITVPQIRGMYRGDLARKQNLVKFGFRLPSALDNRPLNFDEFTQRTHQTLFVSATPGSYELEHTTSMSEQIIRPTGLLDPEVHVIPATQQVDHLVGAMKKAVKNNGRILITTLTKKMAEDLTEYYQDLGFRIKYLHSDVETMERSNLLRGLRKGDFDVLIGINLLREGLDLPEVKLVAVMDADKEGFLRSRRSLIQIIGRAARNHESSVIFYADKITDSMQQAIDETNRRRNKQKQHNIENNIQPKTVYKDIPDDFKVIYGIIDSNTPETEASLPSPTEVLEQYGITSVKGLQSLIKKKQKEMKKVAGQLNFEKAAELRDEVNSLTALYMTMSEGNYHE